MARPPLDDDARSAIPPGADAPASGAGSLASIVPTSRLAKDAARTIYEAFGAYRREFRTLTCRAGERFRAQDWRGLAADARQRLTVRAAIVDRLMERISEQLGARCDDRLVWVGAKAVYSGLIDSRDDWELAETFFNSVTRRVFVTVGVDVDVEFVHSDHPLPPRPATEAAYARYEAANWTALVASVLEDHPEIELSADALRRGAERTAARLEQRIDFLGGRSTPLAEVVRAPFYRGERAYLVGRVPLEAVGTDYLPLVLCFHHRAGVLEVDAALLDQRDVRLLFSYTRSYFHADVARPHDLVQFLKTLMPQKSRAEIYIALGYHKHGKTELYRHALRHLAASTDCYQRAAGVRGLVMVVFTMPSYPVVFKIIKDVCDYPKQCTRREVIDRYRLVFEHDRAGRLIDAQEYEYLVLDRRRFSPALLDELLEAASRSVTTDGEQVVIRHCYAERRVTPLDMYVREADAHAAAAAVVDYGQAIKDLAVTNLFPGDLLLKNFGVTRQKRVVFYDYDEVRLLTDCRFMKLPETDDPLLETAQEAWFGVGENDVFPEEFVNFLGLNPTLKALFVERHGDLLTSAFWRDVQRDLRDGRVVHVPPYDDSRRL